MTTTSNLAVIGFGYSGLMVLANTVREAAGPGTITLFDNAPHAPRGTAYSTPQPEHLLNVRAKNMGAFADDENGFLAWLNQDGKNAREAIGIKTPFDARDFVPRMLYGNYLESIWTATQALAKQKNIALNRVNDRVVKLDKTDIFTLTTQSGEVVTAKQVVLTSGIAFSADVPSDPRYLTNVWQYDFAKPPSSPLPVVVIGTGLTAVDIFWSMINAGWTNEIVAISRNTLLPLPHSDALATHPIDAAALTPIKRLSHAMRFVKQEWRKAAAKNVPWQAVIDGIRPHLNSVWNQLPLTDQQRFLKHYFTRWNVIRHRMPTHVAQAIEAREKAGKLKRISGWLQGATPAPDGIDVMFEEAGKTHHVKASLVFDCRGPQYRNLPTLLEPLLQKRLIAKHGTEFGLNAGINHQIMPGLYVMGSLLMGNMLDTSAVPDLREQAARIGATLAKTL